MNKPLTKKIGSSINAVQKLIGSKIIKKGKYIGRGKSKKNIETLITERVFSTDDWYHDISISKLSKRNNEIAKNLDKFKKDMQRKEYTKTNSKSRLDGVQIQKEKCTHFVEVKLYNFDKLHESPRGGPTLYDIGLWADDLNRLKSLAKAFPNSKVSFFAIGHSDHNLKKYSKSCLFRLFVRKIDIERRSDLKRKYPELKEDERSPYADKVLKALSNISQSDLTIEVKNDFIIFGLDPSRLKT